MSRKRSEVENELIRLGGIWGKRALPLSERQAAREAYAKLHAEWMAANASGN